MRKAWISAALAPALVLLPGPLWALRAPTTVVACSGPFAKDSSHLELVTAFNSKNITFADVEAADGTKVPASILFPNDHDNQRNSNRLLKLQPPEPIEGGGGPKTHARPTIKSVPSAFDLKSNSSDTRTLAADPPPKIASSREFERGLANYL